MQTGWTGSLAVAVLVDSGKSRKAAAQFRRQDALHFPRKEKKKKRQEVTSTHTKYITPYKYARNSAITTIAGCVKSIRKGLTRLFPRFFPKL